MRPRMERGDYLEEKTPSADSAGQRPAADSIRGRAIIL